MTTQKKKKTSGKSASGEASKRTGTRGKTTRSAASGSRKSPGKKKAARTESSARKKKTTSRNAGASANTGRKKSAVRKKSAAKKKTPERKPATRKKTPVKKKAGRPSAKSSGKKLPKKKKNEFKAILIGLKERLVGQMAALKKDSLSGNEPINPEEDGTVAFDRQFALGLVNSERELLFEIDDALDRLENDKYGVCEECGKLIKKPRLKALPFVKMCVKCQSDKERGKARFTPIFGG